MDSSEPFSAKEAAGKPGRLAKPDGRPVISASSPIFKDVHVTLDAALGKAELSVQDLLGLKTGSVVNLDTQLNDVVELRLNGKVVARGEIVAAGDHFAVRIIETAQLT